MTSNTIDVNNSRYVKARLRKRFNNRLIKLANLMFFLALLVGGILLLFYYKMPIGWTLVGFSVVFLMLNFWISNDLNDIPVGKTEDITDLLSENVLVKVNANTTLKDLIKAIMNSTSGTFLRVRFTLPASIFDGVAGSNLSIEQVFETARSVRKETNSEKITGAVLIVAIIKNMPDYETILRRLKTDLPSLYQGVVWFNYLYGVVKDSEVPTRSGGIARDFAFGYTPTLQRFAVNLSERSSRTKIRLQQADHQAVIKQIIDNLTSGASKNAALIGDLGSGRTTMVHRLAEILIDADSKVPSALKFCQVYSLDASSLISASSNNAELEYLMTRILNESYAAKNIILCLDDAHLFFEEGPGSIDISNLLLSAIRNGQFRIVLIMDRQKYLEISTRNPALANSLNIIQMPSVDNKGAMKVLMDQAPFMEGKKHVVYTYNSLVEACRLSEQYVHDVVMPGKAKLLLQSAASYAEKGLVTDVSVQEAVEKSYGVKVKVADTDEDRDKLLNLEELIHERMIDQKEAVSTVANALRRAAAGVKNTKRPIGTFLFVGPTGVGKTELAKTLSEVYFNGENNIIRLDMNEFVSPSDVSRLIKDGAEDSHSLTAQVMKHPFSVVLLDEIEKAHSSVITTLLQVLDEGILRDEKNREISFRDTIIIVTSNAGANEIREKIASGVEIDKFKEEFVESLIQSGEFKPEFLNRFDEICLFKPLSKEDLYKILDLIIVSVNKNLASQKISVSLSDEVKDILVEKGYDPKMGARPMRRIVQKSVENVVAAAIIAGKANPGSVISITKDEININ